MGPLELNPKILNLKESSTLWINNKVKEMRTNGAQITHFGFGQSPFPIHSKIVEKLKKHAAEKDYLPTLGLKELRETISLYCKRKFDYQFDPSQIIIGPGSKELLFQALYALEGTVIIPAPSWVSYGPQVNIRGKHISRIKTHMENGYKLDPKDLDQVCESLTSNQKVLIINTPNNPTGAVYHDQEIQAIVKVCKKHNVIVFSDEIYAEVNFKGDKPKGFYHYYPERTLVTGGMSKAHSAGGYRLGFMATSSEMNELVKIMASLISETYSAVTAPIQYAAVTAYTPDNDIDNYLKLCCEIHSHVSNYIFKRFTDINLLLPKPEGAFYLFPSFKNYESFLKEKYDIQNSKQLAIKLLEIAKVAVLPGSDFYCPPEWLTCRVASVDYDGANAYKALEMGEKLDDFFIERYCPNIAKGCNQIQSFLRP